MGMPNFNFGYTLLIDAVNKDLARWFDHAKPLAVHQRFG
jgi:hypothetical protein